ncbi:MAG: phosphomannomutase/phosphoglucomutase [Thermodesulfobacteriota bacterium]
MEIMEIKEKIFREYDIRGVFGEDLTPGLAELLGRAYAAYLREKTGKSPDQTLKVSVGRDVRLSSGEIRDALVKGLTKAGLDCVDLGECPTPLSYFSLHTLDLDGGIMITGSHNPPEYNGFKVSVGKETIHGAEIQELKEVMKGELPGPAEKSGSVETIDIISKYVDYLTGKFSIGKDLKRPVKVALDAGNGTGGLVAPRLMRALGCEVVELFCEPDGRFPNHHPDPTVEENMQALVRVVKDEGCDFGVGYDGDSDRIGVVDERGTMVWGDQLMVIFAGDILKKTPGATIVGEVKCSQTMYDGIERLGGEAVMWKTGHSLIKARMKELGAAMAGEMSGHIFFADRYFGFDDAVYATCRLAEIMAARLKEDPGAVFSDILKDLPKTFATPEIRVDCPDEEKFGVIEKLRGVVKDGTEDLPVKDVVTIDGLRVIFDEGWALVRASNTQPVLVLRFEAGSEETVERLKEFMREKLREVKPGVTIP